jgi:hypothetical protein
MGGFAKSLLAATSLLWLPIKDGVRDGAGFASLDPARTFVSAIAFLRNPLVKA